MKKIFLLFVVGMFFISLTSAAIDTIEVDDTFKLFDVVNYSKPCFNNGTYCSSAAVCNYTIYLPNNDIYINNQQAENHLSHYSLLVSFQEIGVYQVDMVCHDGGLQGAETFYAQITGSGFNDILGFYFLILIISVGVMIFGFWLKDGWIVILGSFGLYFLGFYIMFFGIDAIKNTTTTFALSLVVLAVAGYISIKSGIEMIGNL